MRYLHDARREGGERDGAPVQRPGPDTREPPDEPPLVEQPDAAVGEGAVVVHAEHAAVARRAVMRAGGARCPALLAAASSGVVLCEHGGRFIIIHKRLSMRTAAGVRCFH